MTHATTLGPVVNAISGLLMVALGLFIGTVKGRSNTNHAFALFGVGFGLAWVFDNLLLSDGHYPLAARLVFLACICVACAALVRLAWVYPMAMTPDHRRLAWWALIPPAVVMIAYLPTDYQTSGWALMLEDGVLGVSHRVGQAAVQAALWFVLFLFVLRARRTDPTDVKTHAGFRVMSTALVLYPAFFLGSVPADLARYDSPMATLWRQAILVVVIVGAYAVLWLRMPRGPDGVQHGRATAAWAFGAATAGVLMALIGDNNPGYGIARTVGVFVLGYAVVRHQLMGIDVKLRWTISKGTTAAVFLGVFFVASEGAQEFFADRAGSQYIGIAAAGALVFVLAPLQRFANGVAERAVPSLEHHLKQSSRDAQTVYLAALRAALADGVLTREEERHLAVVQEGLGITPVEALALRDRVEAEYGHAV